MFKKILSVFLCLTAVLFLASCEKKSKTRKTVDNGTEITNTQGGNGSSTQGGYGDSTTKGGQTTGNGGSQTTGGSQTQAQTKEVKFVASDFKNTGSTYTDLTVTKDGVEYYAHIIVDGGKLQFRAPKPDKNKEGAVLLNKTAGKAVKSITVVTSDKPYDSRTLNFFGLEEPFDSIDDFESAGLEPEGTITITKAGTYTYEFEGSYAYFAFAVTGGAHKFDSITVTYSNEAVKPVEVKPADEALNTAIQALQSLTNYKLHYAYKGTGDFADYPLDVTVYFKGNEKNAIKVETTEEDLTGNLIPVTYYYFVDEQVKYVVFEYSEEDYGDIDWDNFDWSDYLSRKNAEDDSEGSAWYYVTSESADFDSYFYALNLPELDYDSLVYTDFEKIGENKYRLSASKVNSIGDEFFCGNGNISGDDVDYYGDEYHYVCTETYKNFEVTIANGQVSKITVKSNYHEVDTYSDGDETYDGNFIYTIEFSEIGTVDFTIPEATEYVPEGEETKVSNVYTLEDGASVSLAAYINGVNETEKVLYVCDETGSIALHYDDLEPVPALGKIVEFTATVKVTGKLVELVLTNLTIDEADAEQMIGYEVESLEDKDVTYAGEIINFNYLTIKTLDIANKSVVFTTLGGKDITLLFESVKQANKALKDAEVGKSINLKNVAVTLSGDDFALRLTEISSFELANGLKTNKKEFSVAYDTAVKDVLKDVVVSFYQNGVKTVLTAEEYGIDDTGYNKAKPGTYTIVLTKGDQTTKIFVVVELGDEKVDAFKEDQGKGVEYATQRYNLSVGMPSTGDVNILVIPVQFSNTDTNKYKGYKEVLEKGFNGSSEDTGWESLKSYYEKVSYGKLHINATVLDAYVTTDPYYHTAQTANGKSYPNDYLEGYEALDYKYLVEAIAANDSTMDYAKYDANNDGYIDCIYMVYLAPYSTNEDALDIWWAYTYEYYENGGEEVVYDEKGIDYYMWFSYEFFSEEIEGVNFKINTETVIHESGHALGLDDYYDTNYTGNGGLGGGAMMDANVGDHDPYSKAILGWLEPTVVINKDATITIGTFESTGDCIFIAKDYNGVYFNEFYIVELYSPTGVNEIEKGNSGLPSEVGIRIYHVDATPKADTSAIYSVWDLTAVSNSQGDHKLISLVEADGNNSIAQGNQATNSDLWKQGGTLSNIKWYDGSNAGFTIKVEALSTTEATIVIDFAE